MNKLRLFAVFLFFSIFFSTINARKSFSKVGVGIGIGKIIVEDKLKSGQIYNLPNIPVINTGDDPATYRVEITFNQSQSQHFPQASWFTFSPNDFELQPGEIKTVKVNLNLPLKTTPGDYFAYVEAHPVVPSRTDGSTALGIAAASKLSFTILPSSFLQGIYYRLYSLWQQYLPWTNIAAGAIATLVVVCIFKKFFSFDINFQKKQTHPKKQKNE